MSQKKRKDQKAAPYLQQPHIPSASEQKQWLETVSTLDKLPTTNQSLQDFVGQFKTFNLFVLRSETFRRIERITQRPLICYVTKTHSIPREIPARIDETDLQAFSDFVASISGRCADIFLLSNGGSAEATERIVRLLRDRLDDIRFVIAGNAYSAATLMCFAGNEILMGEVSTLGPIDPQINGIPVRAVLRSFETIAERIKKEGIQALAAYTPLLKKYDLHFLEVCKSAEDLSKELAQEWLANYMFKCPSQTSCSDQKCKVMDIVNFFLSYDIHKSHSRGISRQKAVELGLNVRFFEQADPELADLFTSLHNQYELAFAQTPFFKFFEDCRGVNWGRQAQHISVPVPLVMAPGSVSPIT